jgi:acyl-CoA synthetase (AMP-forming)/AMP-acid ligase II
MVAAIILVARRALIEQEMTMSTAMTVARMIEANARHYRDDPAWVFGEKRLSHGAFYVRAKRLADAWRQRGLVAQDRVAVLSRNNLEICEVYAASELSGLITATVSFRFAAPEIAYVLGDSAPKVLVFEAGFAEMVAGLRAGLGSIEHYVCIGDGAPDWAEAYESVLDSGSADAQLYQPRESDTACLIYTSGTTGKPKGCMLSQSGVGHTGLLLNGVMQANEQDKTLLMMPMFHIGAKAIQLGQHWRGGTVQLHRDFDVEAILRTIQDEKITITHMAPTMVQMLLDHPRIRDFDLSSLKMLVYSAAAMPNALLRRGLDLLGPIFLQMYGQTEGTGTMLPIADHRPDGDERDRLRLQSVGIAIPGNSVRIVDDNGHECPDSVPGEIQLAGPTLMQGYWNNSVATLQTLRDGWLNTGDVGRLDENGYLTLVDRKKDMIVSGGENIYSREVEDALYRHAAVAHAAVIGLPDETWGEAVCAVVQLQPGATVSAAELIDFCRTQIASYKKPRRVIFVDELPKLPSGKINKLEIRKAHRGEKSLA